ncbi:radical SAM-linked protein [Propionicimonas paludicola]|uniref:Radical SAM-linked protein n=1 Tax=Propionicimonas paludicola TaxID=185243 RepID=A0A2A9CNT7_9ACTN|nr:TIGR03936 family radical SAM-associated protein [Propionicimonas paludicola]PFG16084.1 radical SAM-linked protein [Propionicimonas paludicola]
MSPRRQPEQQAPPVQKLALRYAKRGRARFASHRDFGRAFERALRRAEVPMAFSSGFHPHPRISYLNASPTGAATEAEYMVVGLAKEVDPGWLRDTLNAALPDGLEILAVVDAPSGLADRLKAAHWQVRLAGADPSEVAAAVRELLAESQHLVTRQTKAGLREFDVRPAIHRLIATEDGFEVISAIGEPLVRPEDVVAALQQLRPRLAEVGPGLAHRLEQGTWDGERVQPPFETIS